MPDDKIIVLAVPANADAAGPVVSALARNIETVAPHLFGRAWLWIGDRESKTLAQHLIGLMGADDLLALYGGNLPEFTQISAEEGLARIAEAERIAAEEFGVDAASEIPSGTLTSDQVPGKDR